MKAGDDLYREAERLGANVTALADIPLADDSLFVKRSTAHKLRRDDLARQQFVASRLDGGSVLDVGLGRGVFVNLCGLSGHFDRVVGVDVKDYRPDRFADWESVEASVEALPFADGEFDSVTAMEIIEHLDEIDVALSELRRVAGKRLVVTVPFCEQPPIYKGHRQRFCADRLRELFPNAEFTLLAKEVGTSWAMIEESFA